MIPPTQASAYRAIIESGELSRLQRAVYEWLYQHPFSTRDELDSALGDGKPNCGASRRLAEMERGGVVERGPSRCCRITGRMKETWATSCASTVNKAAMKAKPKRELLIEQIREAVNQPSETLFPDPRLVRVKLLLESSKHG